MVGTKADVLAILQQHREDWRALGVARFGLFGSFRRNTPDADSDIDLLVEFRPGHKTFLNLSAIADLIEQETGRAVDLLTPEALSPHLGPHILQEIEYVTISA